MKFKITLVPQSGQYLPVNYQYPLSAAIYRILSKGNTAYASFLHQTGYGKGFKLFTFSQLNVPFKMEGDRLKLTGNEAYFQVAFHLPQAMESFVKGLFQSEAIVIADKKSKVTFSVKSVESLPNPLQQYKENELVHTIVKPLSPIVAGLMKEDGKYDFLSPEDPRFIESLIFNWRSKIDTCCSNASMVDTLHCNVSTIDNASADALLMMEVIPIKQPFKSRLITIKGDTEQETKIRGWLNFELKIIGEKRFVELLLNAGCGVYNSMGCGCVEVKAQ